MLLSFNLWQTIDKEANEAVKHQDYNTNLIKNYKINFNPKQLKCEPKQIEPEGCCGPLFTPPPFYVDFALPAKSILATFLPPGQIKLDFRTTTPALDNNAKLLQSINPDSGGDCDCAWKMTSKFGWLQIYQEWKTENDLNTGMMMNIPCSLGILKMAMNVGIVMPDCEPNPNFKTSLSNEVVALMCNVDSKDDAYHADVSCVLGYNGYFFGYRGDLSDNGLDKHCVGFQVITAPESQPTSVGLHMYCNITDDKVGVYLWRKFCKVFQASILVETILGQDVVSTIGLQYFFCPEYWLRMKINTDMEMSIASLLKINEYIAFGWSIMFNAVDLSNGNSGFIIEFSV